MEKKYVLCEECRKEVDFILTETSMNERIKNEEIHFIGKEARCPECGSLLYIPEINDFNLKTLYDEYRRRKGIVSLEVIRAIPEKYAIGKRPLSLLLGWGEQTFTRYYDGDLPTKQYSEILSKIYENPIYYAELLEAGKENLKTTAAYEKSKKAVEVLILEADEPISKIEAVVRTILNQCGDITPLTLQKALYYIQGFYYAFHNEFLFSENCEAWIHGPVYRDIYNRYRTYHFDPIIPCAPLVSPAMTEVEAAVINCVVQYFCCYGGKTLEQFTHQEDPWLNARKDLPKLTSARRIIPKESIGDYFMRLKEKYNMEKPEDIRFYAEDRFLTIMK